MMAGSFLLLDILEASRGEAVGSQKGHVHKLYRLKTCGILVSQTRETDTLAKIYNPVKYNQDLSCLFTIYPGSQNPLQTLGRRIYILRLFVPLKELSHVLHAAPSHPMIPRSGSLQFGLL